jgi:hypothetical protein
MIDGNLTAAASPAASVGGLFHFKPNGQCRLLALSGQSNRTRVCPLSDKGGFWPATVCQLLTQQRINGLF